MKKNYYFSKTWTSKNKFYRLVKLASLKKLTKHYIINTITFDKN